MTGGERSVPPPHRAGGDLKDLSRELAQDWMTVWQSELSALAVDREIREAWHLMSARWTEAATALFGGMGVGAMGVGGMGPGGLGQGAPYDPAGTGFAAAAADAAPRAPPAAAAPDPRDAEVGQLRERVLELEQRLAKLERRRR
jgi:hypothetical protein